MAHQAVKKKMDTYQHTVWENQAITLAPLLDPSNTDAMFGEMRRRGAIDYERKFLHSLSLTLATTPLLAQS